MNSELRLSKEELSVSRTLTDCSAEMSLERDIVLPDYYPDIFRILKCRTEPSVVSQSINGSKLTIEAQALIRILYLSENDRRINCIEQKVNVSKTVDIQGEPKSPTVRTDICCDYMNCRVVNRRRLDIRGAMTAKIRVCEDISVPVITSASGAGIQLKKQPLTYPCKRLSAAKRITVIEETELPQSKPQIGAVLRCGCLITAAEHKVIAGKLVAKGEAEISILYSCVDSTGEDTAETLRFTLPFSQIIDIDGIDESFEANIDMTAAGCTVLPKGESSTALECELVLNVCCTAVQYKSGEAVIDAYSTEYETDLEKCSERIEAPSVKLSETCKSEYSLSCNDGGIGSVCDCYAECSNISVRREEKKLMVTGNTNFTVIGMNEDKMPFLLEGQTAFEQEFALPDGMDDDTELMFEPRAEVTGCSYFLNDSNGLEIKADIRISGRMTSYMPSGVLSGITIDTEKPKNKEQAYALKLCRSRGEDLWDIAKRYSTSVRAITEENKDTEGMLLIPLGR